MTLEMPPHGPTVHGRLGHGQDVPYIIRLLDTRRLLEIDRQCTEYMTGRVGLKTSTTSSLHDNELVLRICAEVVRHPETNEPLASLAVWRRLPGAHVAQCARQFAELVATEQPDAERLAAILSAVSERVTELRTSVAHVLEDCRVLFARDLWAYYGEPAAQLSLMQVAYFVHYRATLHEESSRK